MMNFPGGTVRETQSIDNMDQGIEKCAQPSASHHGSKDYQTHENCIMEGMAYSYIAIISHYCQKKTLCSHKSHEEEKLIPQPIYEMLFLPERKSMALMVTQVERYKRSIKVRIKANKNHSHSIATKGCKKNQGDDSEENLGTWM